MRERKFIKIAAARSFYESYAKQVQAIAPHAFWSLFEQGGSWSSSPTDCDLAVLIGDAYCLQFKEALLHMPTLKWVHSENSGIDGHFYNIIRE